MSQGQIRLACQALLEPAMPICLPMVAFSQYGRAEKLHQRLYGPQSQKYWLSGSLQEKFAHSYCRVSMKTPKFCAWYTVHAQYQFLLPLSALSGRLYWLSREQEKVAFTSWPWIAENKVHCPQVVREAVLSARSWPELEDRVRAAKTLLSIRKLCLYLTADAKNRS